MPASPPKPRLTPDQSALDRLEPDRPTQQRKTQDSQPLQPAPAATVVLARPGRAGDGIEVLLLQRSARLVFHGGHWVFPGGRIDAADFAAADSPLEYPAARKAALRETREETGIRIDEDLLIHVGHWTTPPGLPRRFATWFFVCPLRQAAEVRVDQDEIRDHRWLTPRQALLDAREEVLVLPRPTRITLSDISVYDDLEQLEQGLKTRPIRVFPPDSEHYRPAESGCPSLRQNDGEGLAQR